MAKVGNNIKGNRILITGANGFPGQTILPQLQAAGFSVLATDLDAGCCVLNTPYRKADITKAEEMKPIFENITTVIHAAGLAHVFIQDERSGEKIGASLRVLNTWASSRIWQCLCVSSMCWSCRHIVKVCPRFCWKLRRVAGPAVSNTDTPGCRDAILNEKTGLLVPLKDAHTLASAIKRLVLDGELRRSMGEGARELALEKFDVRKIVKAHLELYDALSADHCPSEVVS